MNAALSSSDQNFTAAFDSGRNFSAEFEHVYVVPGTSGLDTYTGPYEVTPKVEGQQLATALKYMNQDVNIKAIPFYDVSNAAGGTTIYIANELD